jgi:hypothetical protein
MKFPTRSGEEHDSSRKAIEVGISLLILDSAAGILRGERSESG